jgi:hypothetical protein
MADPTIDTGSPPPPAPSPASGGGSGWGLVPVDHDPFNSPSISLVPVDHDPFAAGSAAQPQKSSSDNGFGAPNSQYQLSPLGRAGQSVSPYDVTQAVKYGQPFTPRPISALSAGQASASDTRLARSVLMLRSPSRGRRSLLTIRSVPTTQRGCKLPMPCSRASPTT